MTRFDSCVVCISLTYNFRHGYSWRMHFTGKFTLQVMRTVHESLFDKVNAPVLAGYVIREVKNIR